MTNKTAEQTIQHLPEVGTMKFVQHAELAECIILTAELNKTEGETVFIGVNW